MKGAGRWILLGAAILACVACAYGAYTLAGVSWNGVVDYTSPYAGVSLAPTEPSSEVASRTVLVIIDGLREDASRRMPSLDRLRDYGMDLALTAPQPSLSYPNWTTILSGARPEISGVVTNWHEGPAPVETLFDTARRADRTTVFVGPEDFEPLYGVRGKTAASMMLKWDERYLSARYVDDVLRLADSAAPSLIVVHLPDVDEAGHSAGGASDRYRRTVARVDVDLRRLVEGLADGRTTFVVVADHGHIADGGHGGWERDVTTVPCVVSGPGIPLRRGSGALEDVAPTVATLCGIPVPRYATGISLLAEAETPANRRFAAAYRNVVLAPTGADPSSAPSRTSVSTATGMMRGAQDARMRWDRGRRVPMALLGVLAALLPVAFIAVASRQALVASLAGACAYYAIYNGLFFGFHGYRWSLSAFNSEDRIGAWMNGRLLEAAIAALLAVAVAGLVYPFLRREPKGARGAFLAGWLTLGPMTLLVVLSTLGLQVAWFVWAWGVIPTWRLPDLMWGFKYDLDLIQATAVGFMVVVAPLVTYLVGRYHPRVARAVDATE